MNDQSSSKRANEEHKLGREQARWRLFTQHDACESAETAVLIVPPFGEESKIWRRPMSVIAEVLRENGIECLRFDLSSCGESEGCGVDFRCWVEDVAACVERLRSTGRPKRLVLLGIRVGAALSVLAMQNDRGANQIWIDPVFDIATFFENLDRRGNLHKLLYGEPARSSEETVDIEGCKMAGDFRGQLERSQRDLDSLLSGALAEHVVVRSGHYRSNDHFGTNRQSRPERIIDLDADWGRDVANGRLGALCLEVVNTWRARSTMGGESRVTGHTTTDRILSDETLYGRAVHFKGPHGVIRGCFVECRTSDYVVVFLHGRIGYRIGPNRIFCEASDALRRQGVSSLRFDFVGWGDSCGPAYDPSVDLDEAAVDRLVRDVQAAVDFVVTCKGGKHVILCGICVGGYVALRSLKKLGDKVLALVLLSPYVMGVENRFAYRLNSLRFLFTEYLAKVFRRRNWRRLIQGQVSIRRIAAIFINRAFANVPDREDLRSFRVPGAGKPCLQIYSEHDPARHSVGKEIAAVYGKTLNSEIRIVDRADHNFSDEVSRARAVQLMCRFLERLQGGQRA